MNFLETEDVVKQYANHLALNKVSIQVPEGKYSGYSDRTVPEKPR